MNSQNVFFAKTCFLLIIKFNPEGLYRRLLRLRLPGNIKKAWHYRLLQYI
jgi:hypothetical protein